MRVAMYYSNKDIRIEDFPRPRIGPNELLVKSMACGICGSDVMEWYRIEKAPRILGHEMTGEIVEVGERTKYKVGDRVFVSHHVPCNKCRYCLNGQHTVCETLHSTNVDPGGFSEFFRVPEINVRSGTFLLPEKMSFEDGTFIEPLGCVIRGQRKANLGAGDTVLVIGSGISGLLHIQLARINGAEKVIATDINEHRLNAAKRFGADEVIDAREDVPVRTKEVNQGRLADRVIVCTGALSAIDQALKSVDRGGNILFFAPTDPGTSISLPLNELWMNQTTLTTTYAAAPRDLREAKELIRLGKLNVHDMITHRLGLAQVAFGFELVTEASESIKVIVEPQR